jgi:hypothetical protein
MKNFIETKYKCLDGETKKTQSQIVIGFLFADILLTFPFPTKTNTSFAPQSIRQS